MPKPKLTPEEKKALRLQKKAEKRRKSAERARKIKFDHLGREVKYGNLTVQRYEKKWRDMLMKISASHMRDELIFAWHNFERVIDTKDFAISLLMDEIREAEEQYQLNLRQHSENIDRLIRMFHDKLQEMRDDNHRDIQALQTASTAEQEAIKANAGDDENFLKTMIYGLEMESKAQVKRVRGEYLSRIDEEEKKYADRIQTLKSGLERKLENMWSVTTQFIDEYQKRTSKRQKEYLSMKQQDDSLQILLAEQLLKIKRFYEVIKMLKQRYLDIEKEQKNIIDDLTLEKTYFTNIFFTLKHRLETDTTTDRKHLVLLTTKSNNIINVLREYKTKGKWILTLSSIFRKLETLSEKILPFPLPPTQKHTTTKSVVDLTQLEFEGEDLYLFWHRVGEADAVRYSLIEEKDFLTAENDMLQKKIHRFCQCLDCAKS